MSLMKDFSSPQAYYDFSNDALPQGDAYAYAFTSSPVDSASFFMEKHDGYSQMGYDFRPPQMYYGNYRSVSATGSPKSGKNRLRKQKSQEFGRYREVSGNRKGSEKKQVKQPDYKLKHSGSDVRLQRQNSDFRLQKSKSMDMRIPKRTSRKLNRKESQRNLRPQSEIDMPVKELEEHTESECDDSYASDEVEPSEQEKEKRKLRNQKRKARRMRAKAAMAQEKAREEEEVGNETIDPVQAAADVTLDSIFDDDSILTDLDGETPVTTPGPKPKKSIAFDTKNVSVGRFEPDLPSTKLEKPEVREMGERKISIEETIRLNRKKSMEAASQNPFDLIKLRPTTKSTMNSKYAEKLPEILPVKTIIGLSHKQILNLDNSDVKLKTIISSAKISKYASAGLAFTSNHSEELFGDPAKCKILITLCINVALYESIGFKKTVRVYPNILELFGGYSEINLETTRTKLTPSTKDIHKNTLDYSVLSYLGHILIWAAHHQRKGGVELFTKDYDFDLSASLVRENVGGYHLWDRLIREPSGMNAKRWKHIIKFRSAFPYEEDQFMLILRFMRITEVP